MRNATIPELGFHLEGDTFCSGIQKVIKFFNKVLSQIQY